MLIFVTYDVFGGHSPIKIKLMFNNIISLNVKSRGKKKLKCKILFNFTLDRRNCYNLIQL